MKPEPASAQQALAYAQQALRKGDRLQARRWAERAAALAPDEEAPWLILAAVASPRASVSYLKRALEINPHSQRAREGMHWAIQRLRANPPPAPAIRKPLVAQTIASEALVKPRPALLLWTLAVLILAAGLIAWFGSPPFSFAFSSNKPLAVAQIDVSKNTRTPTPTNTPTPTPTFTPTPTPTDTPTPTPTDTPTATPTATPPPTNTPKPPKASNTVYVPDGIGQNERWIDVDLSQQRTYAYQGDQLINSFLVSTGTWLHPTVTGKFRIYVKYRYADMSGPGYYLPNVPYVMYFYRGYGLHGTYWHSNFGTPMSHGCINLTTEAAGWLFNWASVGTVVNVHP